MFRIAYNSRRDSACRSWSRSGKGGGLAKSWSQRLRINGRPSNVGLGRYPIVTLAEARERALENARAVDQGRDPRDRSRIPTFEAAEKVIALYEPTWRTQRRGLIGDGVAFVSAGGARVGGRQSSGEAAVCVHYPDGESNRRGSPRSVVRGRSSHRCDLPEHPWWTNPVIDKCKLRVGYPNRQRGPVTLSSYLRSRWRLGMVRPAR